MKALCVFSGGLDSMLAAELIRAQGIDTLAFFFETPFFPRERAVYSASILDLPLKVLDITQSHLEIVKNPRYGYGKNMNPCMDCHILMFRTAFEMLETEGAHFVVSGEVLGQRPMSQNKKALSLIASESNLGRLLLRPLSAACLPETIPEKSGWIRRELLPGIQGRSRKPQIELAKVMGISHYPSPAGGCLLTEQAFSRRLKDLLHWQNKPSMKELEILKLGRHFRISPNAKLVVGRNKEENQSLRSLGGEEHSILTTLTVPGPTALFSFGEFLQKELQTAASIVAAYSDTEEGEETPIRVEKEGENRILSTQAPDKGRFKHLLV